MVSSMLSFEDLYARQDILGQALMTSFAEMLELPPETFTQFFEGVGASKSHFHDVSLHFKAFFDRIWPYFVAKRGEKTGSWALSRP